MKEELKNIIIMGLGAMAMTNEKAQELKKELLEKGTKIYNDSKVANEELKHTIKDKIKENVTVVVENKDLTTDELVDKIKNMDEEEKKEILNLLKEVKKNEKNK